MSDGTDERIVAIETIGASSMLNGGHFPNLGSGRERPEGGGVMGGVNAREQRRPMWTQHEKTVLRLLMREYAGVTEFDPPDIHKHPIKNEMWRLLTARYNDHPNVRTRDTKQLRKAWENLKYRARKLGGDAKRNGSTPRCNSVSGTEGLDAPWPLDGVSLSLSGVRDPQDTESQEDVDAEEDSKSVILEDELKGFSWGEERVKKNSRTPEEGFDVSQCLEGPTMKVPPDGVFNASKFGSFGGDHLPNGGRGAILSLQPLVTSLVGGALPALLPFLSPPSNPHFSGDFLLNNPFTHSFVPPSEDCPSETSLLKEDIGPPQSAQPPAFSQPWPSNPLKGATPFHRQGGNVKKEELSSDPDEEEGEESPVTPGTPASGTNGTPGTNVSRLLSKRLHEEQQHSATLQLLRTQLAHAEAQHEIKMKLLDVQLQYWQTKLKLQRGSLSAQFKRRDEL